MASPVKDSAWLEWIATLMGGTPRRTHASTFPPDRFYCLLDDLPLHLIPPAQFATLSLLVDDTQQLCLNPELELLADGRIPAILEENSNLLDAFALQGTIAWVPGPASGCVLPFWLGPALREVIAGLSPQRPITATLAYEVRFLLAASGILTPPGHGERSRERHKKLIEKTSAMFRDRDYAPIAGLIHPFHLAALRRYYRYMIRCGNVLLGDGQSPRRYVAHNEPVARFFHSQIAQFIARLQESRSNHPTCIWLLT